MRHNPPSLAHSSIEVGTLDLKNCIVLLFLMGGCVRGCFFCWGGGCLSLRRQVVGVIGVIGVIGWPTLIGKRGVLCLITAICHWK